ncbi:MAG: hypothetical protein ACFFD6_05940, partial [Candidatus Thorarchaeota archaeon]
EEIVSMLRDLHRVTKPDGIILATSRDVAATDNQQHLEYHEKNRAMRNPIGLVKIRIRYKGHVGGWWLLRMANAEEMSAIAEKAGWFLEKTYGPRNLFVGVLRKR